MELTPEINRLMEQASSLKKCLHAPNTITGYTYDFKMFERWCAQVGRVAMPATAETVCLYLAYLLFDDGKKVSTAERRATAIQFQHRKSGNESPMTDEVRELLTAARRSRGDQPRRMIALTIADLRKMTDLLTSDNTPAAIRNRAILVMGVASGLRRSNLVALDLADIEFVAGGAIATIHREKQDQEGKGRCIGLPRGKRASTCPVRTLKAWLRVRPGGQTPGPLFTRVDLGGSGGRMDAEAIAKIVKACVERIGLDPTNYGAHSMRASLVTMAAEAGVSDLVIAAQTGHRCVQTLKAYYRRTNLFRHNAAAKIGL